MKIKCYILALLVVWGCVSCQKKKDTETTTKQPKRHYTHREDSLMRIYGGFVPANAFFNHFRCKGKTNNTQVLTNEAIDSELFTTLPQRSYKIKTIVIPNSDRGLGAFPIFESGNKAKDKTINQIIKMSVENDGIFDLELMEDWHGIIQSETVVANESFLCIHVVVGSCGNTCHQHTQSVNIDLRNIKRISNCELLSMMNISVEKFEDMIRTNWSKIRVADYEDKYPTFKDVANPNVENETDEVEGQNRYTTDFNETLQEASILPVVYKNGSLTIMAALHFKSKTPCSKVFKISHVKSKSFHCSEYIIVGFC
jgi:hypothetical protein